MTSEIVVEAAKQPLVGSVVNDMGTALEVVEVEESADVEGK